MPTYKELLAEKQALEARLNEARENEIGAVIEKIRALMDDYGLTVDDLAPRRGRGRPRGVGGARTAVPAKYMDPKTGKTWSGRGRAPSWLGKRPERFLIKV
ncbi:H-NS family nucleoid-associated regulatory protein [Cupriavidus nantongensis]|uniref:DNA-binding protein n=1 Tax=Cupriavidus nantongensis TaxID=1796606 RepID=A0A142JKM0_9BURK|nr:H-NS histone family protein [Cupriavidus nantongensis]AMR78632.1 DNA-binding protein [Cupriavidus nantongensis]